MLLLTETSEVIMGGRIFLQGDDVCGWVESGCHGDKQVVVHSIARQVHN